MTILDILNEVAATSSRNEKEEILTRHACDETLKRIFKFAYDKQILFYTRTIPDEAVWGTEPPHVSLSDLLNCLEDDIISRSYTGHAAERYIEDLFKSAAPEDAEVLKRVILKDLRIGATSGTANKVWKGLIDKPAFMLAQTDNKNIVYPAYSQLKEDGTRGKFIYDGETVTIMSRNGNDIETHGTFNRWAQRMGEPTILDGELVAFRDGKRLSRKESNGIVNKAVRGTITPEEAALLVYVAWDIETRPELTYDQRFALLEEWDNTVVNLDDKNKVITVENRIVNTYEEALEHFKDARRRGLEGTLLKNIKSKWQPKRSFDLVKFKAEYEGEFRVVGFEYGKKGTKNEKRLGALHIESLCGRIKSDVGVFKDFPETIREEWLDDMPKVVTVRYNERITSKNSEFESLYLPRVIAARWDKDIANTREELIEQEKNAIKG